MVELYPLREFRYPIFAECLSPDVLEGLTIGEMENLEVWEGNQQKTLKELFQVRIEEPETYSLHGQGDFGAVRRIGAKMTKGEITIDGDVGMHLGEEMKGGKITVKGNVGSWAGSMMKNGEIEIHGNVADYLGAPYRGSTSGMRGGRIVVYGNVGSETGTYLKKGMIKIYGSAGQFVGFRNSNGTIYVQKNCGSRAGACMVGGKIIVGGFLESILPTFTIDDVKSKVKIEEDETVNEHMYLFLGDIAESGNGKLFVSKAKNPQLSIYEKLL